jgi:hypothetical protein
MRHPRLPLSIALAIALLACAACEDRQGTALSVDLGASASGSSPFAIRRQGLYSISYECTVRDASNRRAAWRLLEATTLSAGWNPETSVAREGAREARPIDPVEHPRLSSWNGRHLSIELARARLEPGRYELRHAVPLPATNPPCESRLVVAPAYVGK